MKGHVRKRGSLWEVVLELGEQPAQRCPACVDSRGRGRRYWTDKGRLAVCPTCGGQMTDIRARRQIVLPDRFRTKRPAEEALTRQLNAGLTGVFVEPAELTVGDFLLNSWLPTVEGAPSSLVAYRLHVEKRINPSIGEIRLQKLTTKDVDLLYSRLRTEPGPRGHVLSAETRRGVHFALRRGLQAAVKWRLIPSNPAADAEKPKRDRRVMDTWTAEQLGSFLAATSSDRLGPLWRLYAMTGMRRGEALALRWSDVDLDGGKLHVQLSRTKQGYEAVERSPKGGSGRTISIGPETVAVLRQQSQQQLDDAAEWKDAWVGDGHVFTRENGEPWHPDRVYDLFCQAVKVANSPTIRVHDLRHTHATRHFKLASIPRSSKSVSGTRASSRRWIPTRMYSKCCTKAPLTSLRASSPRPPATQTKRRAAEISEYKRSTRRGNRANLCDEEEPLSRGFL